MAQRDVPPRDDSRRDTPQGNVEDHLEEVREERDISPEEEYSSGLSSDQPEDRERGPNASGKHSSESRTHSSRQG